MLHKIFAHLLTLSVSRGPSFDLIVAGIETLNPQPATDQPKVKS
jgi:hypothetical protein